MESYRTAITILLILGVCTIVEAKYMKYKDPKQPLNKRISDLLSRMTLAEKVGQMSQIERKYAFPEVMKNYFIGSVLSGGGSTPAYRASAKIWVDMVNTMQKGALSTRLGIPFMYGIDAVHGQNTVYGATIFPHNVGLGVTRDPVLVKKIGEATALEVRATGIPYIFAPCVAVCRDPRWGRCYESYSEDTKIVEDMTDFIYGLQGEIPANSRKGVPYIGGKTKVAACAKHYAGDGGTYKGINGNNTLLNQHKFLSIHMSPYYHSIIKGVSTVMLSYSSWNGVKMHADKFLITDFLKKQLRFRGFVTTDWQGIDNILPQNKQNYTYSVLTGINAGIDMVMIPYDFPDFVSNLTYLVENNFIAMNRIDDAVRRILRVKFTLGLFENPYADLSLADQIGKKEHRELAREAVRKSLVLLKNGKIGQKPILPLPKNMNKLLVAGTHAHNLGYQCGGWTIEWQGEGGNNLTIGTTLLEAVKSTVSPSTEILYSEFPDTEYIKKIKETVSYAIVAVGEYPYAETAGDNFTLEMAETGPDTIKNVCTYIKCVVIVMSGRPIVLEPYVNVMDALVAAWLPGSEGKGITDVLFGDFGFTGKLARTWFKSVEQLPMNVGDPHYDPLYPFGYGLAT